MPSLVITNAAIVRLIWARAGAPYAINVLGALNTGPATFNQALADTLGASIKAAFGTSGFNGAVSSDISLSQVGVRSIATANQPEFPDANAAVAGIDVSDPLPAQTSLCVTLRTANAGSSYRGRVYLPGFAEANNDTDGTCSSGATAVALAFVNAIKSSMASSGLTMAVLSRPREAKVIPAVTITAKSGFATAVDLVMVRDRVWDTQRRRLTAGV